MPEGPACGSHGQVACRQSSARCTVRTVAGQGTARRAVGLRAAAPPAAAPRVPGRGHRHGVPPGGLAARSAGSCWSSRCRQSSCSSAACCTSNCAPPPSLTPTGLLNAVAWQRDAERWIRRARRLSVPAAILLVDIDRFKRVNDTYGHLAGDELLAATASTLGQHVRACDVLGRFGGEEFVAVLPGAGQQEACHIAERLRGRARDIAVQARGATVTVTVSIGVAALGVDGEEPVRNARRGRCCPVPGQEVRPGPGVHASPRSRAVRPAALIPLTLEHAGIYLSDAGRPLGEG